MRRLRPRSPEFGLLSFLLPVALAIALQSCASRPEERGGVSTAGLETHELELTRTLEKMIGALEEENSFALFELVSENFSPSKLGLKYEVDIGLERNTGYGYHIHNTRVNVDEGRGTLVVEWKLVRMNRETSQAQFHSGMTELIFLRENGSWRLETMNGDKIFCP